MKEQATSHWKLIALLAVGALLGSFADRLWSTPSAEAQDQPQFRECMALSLHSHDGTAFANPEWRPQTIAIRRGWTVVGGAGRSGTPYAVVCR